MMGNFIGTYKYIGENILVSIYIPFYSEVLLIYVKKESINSYRLVNKSESFEKFFNYLNNNPLIVRNPG